MLTIKEAAPLLGKKASGVRKLIDRSRLAAEGRRVSGDTIRFFQDGKKGAILFRPEWIDEYIERNTVVPRATGEAAPRIRCGGKVPLDWSDV